jgi:hypothetical protein
MPIVGMVRLAKTQEHHMLDIAFLALGLGGFALMCAYAAACSRLRGTS